MKHMFKRVVVLINDINKIDDLLKKGVEFSKQHNKTLEVLFVQEKATNSLLDYFLSSHSKRYTSLDKDSLKEKIQKHIQQLDANLKSEIFITEENILKVVSTHAKECKDILFITNYNKYLSQKLLKKTPYSYWIFKNSSLTYNNIVLPIELSDDVTDDIKLTKDIFPKSSIGIVHDYRYMIPRVNSDGSAVIVPVIGNIDKELHHKTRAKHKSIFNNYKKKFNVDGDFIEEKRGLNKDLINYIKNRDTDLVVIHHHEEVMFVPSLTFNLLDKVSSNFLVLNS